MLPLIPCLASSCLVACSRPPYPQSISGVLLKAGQAAAAVRVRFISTESAGACATEGLDGITAPDGRFHLDQMYQPSTIETLIVLVHPYELCVAVGGAWKPLWQETTGPAPTSIELECTRQSARAVLRGTIRGSSSLLRRRSDLVPSNNRMNPTVGPSRPVHKSARAAHVPPAGYPERYADMKSRRT